MTELGECPRCKIEVKDTAKRLTGMQRRDALLREIDEFVEERWHDSDAPEHGG